MAIPEIDTEKCMGCGECVEHCPTHAVALVEGKATIVTPEDCTYCTECEAWCPPRAIQCPFEIILKEQEPGNAQVQL